MKILKKGKEIVDCSSLKIDKTVSYNFNIKSLKCYEVSSKYIYHGGYVHKLLKLGQL